ncbi:MAG: flagellar export chaperone FliS [Gammaproteobacteria bacterium]|nr:flagellar export chaperone FliS [Gammaproteobacteria bacterium]MBQ0839518.1 flagellar export chaperone FliS [Gammaproteobacteria bacterium]
MSINQYRKVQSQGAVNDASPHMLIAMLLRGALDNIAVARGAIGRGETALKGEKIGRAIDIVDNLRSSLDLAVGGEVAQNLKDLYDYMEGRLLSANMEDNTQALEEVASLLGEIAQGWNAMPEEFKKAPSRHSEAS